MPQLWTNNARALLTGAITSGSTTIVIESTKADSFPTANTNGAAVGDSLNWFKATLQNTAGAIEIVYVRTRAGGSNVLTNVLRAQEGTAAIAFAAGSVLECRLTAADLEAFRAAGSSLESLLRNDTGNDTGAGVIAFNYARGYVAGKLGRWLQDLALAAGSTFIGWIQDGVGAALRTIRDKLRERVSVADWGVVGNGTDETVGILAAALAAQTKGCTLWFPRPISRYVHSQPIPVVDGFTIEGEGTPNRWRSTKDPTRIDYTGSVGAVTAIVAAGQGIDSITIRNMQWDGRGAAAGCNGLHLVATTGSGAYVEGVFLDNSAFRNFPKHQIFGDGTVFDVTVRRGAVSNPLQAVGGDDLVRIANSMAVDPPSQWLLEDLYQTQYADGKWCTKATGCQDLRLKNGTLAPYSSGLTGAHGVYADLHLDLTGTHVESNSTTTVNNIGIHYLGSNGARIKPSQCALFGRNVVIGDGSASAARGFELGGNIGNHNAGTSLGNWNATTNTPTLADGTGTSNNYYTVTVAGTQNLGSGSITFAVGDKVRYDGADWIKNGVADVHITAGGTRSGHIGPIGFANGTPTIVNDRVTVDGVTEVTYNYLGFFEGLIRSVAGSAAAPGLAVGVADQGLFDTGSGLGVAAGGALIVDVRATDVRLTKRLYLATPAGAAQTATARHAGTGVPSNALGGDGDFYDRSDGTVAGNTVCYHKEGGVWVPFTTT